MLNYQILLYRQSEYYLQIPSSSKLMIMQIVLPVQSLHTTFLFTQPENSAKNPYSWPFSQAFLAKPLSENRQICFLICWKCSTNKNSCKFSLETYVACIKIYHCHVTRKNDLNKSKRRQLKICFLYNFIETGGVISFVILNWQSQFVRQDFKPSQD